MVMPPKDWEHSLPTEIRQSIFKFLLPVPPINVPPDPDDFEEMPWLLTRVCSRWRSDALTTSELWRNVIFDLKGLIVPDARLAIGEEIGKRSGNQPLDVTCQTNLMEYVAFANSAEFVKGFLLKNLRRLRSLSYTGGTEALQPFLDQPQGSLERLENLELWISKRVHREGLYWEREATVFTQASSLKRFSITAVYQEMNADFLNVDWERLEQLELRRVYVPISTFLPMLQSCTNLTYLRCGFQVPPGIIPTEENAPALVELPYLRSLDVTIDPRSGNPLGLFDFITLERLVVRLSFFSWNPKFWADFSKLSCKNVESLALFFLGTRTEIDRAISDVFTSINADDWPLRDVRLFCPNMSAHNFDAIADGALPKMTRFTAIVSVPDTIERFIRCISLLHSRAGKLTRVTMVPVRGLTEDDREKVAKLVAKGINIQATTAPIIEGFEESVDWDD